jgi:hypothetical protein
MAMSQRRTPTVLVIGDDADLGGLTALNLRRRGLRVEHTDLLLAITPRWAPVGGRPQLLVVQLERPSLAAPARLGRLLERPWARGVPFVLAATEAEALSLELTPKPTSIVDQPDDVGAIVRAVNATLVGAPVG